MITNITPQQAKQIIDSDSDYYLVDVRTAEEYEQSHIPGSILLPLSQLAELMKETLPDKNKKILVYCRSGNRSARAAIFLDKNGYSDINNFGGIIDWPYETTK